MLSDDSDLVVSRRGSAAMCTPPFITWRRNMKSPRQIAFMVHDLLQLNSIALMAKPFMEIVHAYSHVIANDPALQGTMKWRMKEIMNQDPMIRVCIDHMIMTAGGITKWGEDPGYLVIENMVFMKEEEPSVGRRTRVKDDINFDEVDEKVQTKPGDDLYADNS